jgi:hypothetical protein
MIDGANSPFSHSGSRRGTPMPFRFSRRDSGEGQPDTSLRQQLIRDVVALVGMCLIAACGAPTVSPTAPSRPPSGPSGSVAFPIHLQGMVSDRDGGARIPGATITVFTGAASPQPPTVTTSTDAFGHYEIEFSGTIQATVTASRDGFEPTVAWADVIAGIETITKNLQLDRTVHLMAGDALTVMIAPGGQICGLEDEWFCRIIRVSAPQSGSLVLGVSSTDAAARPAVGIGSPRAPFVPQYPCCPPATQVPVSAGDEVIAEAMLPWTMSKAALVTLNTSLR